MNYDFPGSKKSPVTWIFTPNELEGSTGNNESSQHSGAYIFRPKRQQDGFRILGWEVSRWVEKCQAFEEFEKWSSAFNLKPFFFGSLGAQSEGLSHFSRCSSHCCGACTRNWVRKWNFIDCLGFSKTFFLCGVWFPSPRNESHNIPCPDTRSLGLSPCIQIGGVVIHSWTGRLKISTVPSFCDPRCQTMKIGLLFHGCRMTWGKAIFLNSQLKITSSQWRSISTGSCASARLCGSKPSAFVCDSNWFFMPCCHGQNPQFFVVPFSEIVIYPIGPDTLQPLGGLHSHSGMTISMIWHQALPIFTGLPFMQIIRGELADEASVGFFCFLLGTWVPGLWHECGVYMVFCSPNLWFCYFQKHFDLVSAHFPAKLSLKNDCCGSGVHIVFCFKRGDFLLEGWLHTFAVSACGGVTLRAKGWLNTTTK